MALARRASWVVVASALGRRAVCSGVWLLVLCGACGDEKEESGAASGQAGSSAGAKASGGSASGGKTGGSGSSSGSTSGRDAATGGEPVGGGQAAGANGTGNAGGGSGGGTPQPSSGCGTPGATTAPGPHTIQVGATARSYELTPPTDYVAETPYPVVFGFHGAGGTGKGARDTLQLEKPAGGQALFVYPNGMGGWVLSNDGTDMQLIDAILADLKQSYCVDENAIFAAGFSYGGWMATQLACARPTVVRGIASIAGGGPMGGCQDSVAAMIVHGTADNAEPIAAGEGSRDRFRDGNGCADSSSAVEPAPCMGFDGCSEGHPTLWCPHPGGHGVPAFAPPGIWNFFMGLR